MENSEALLVSEVGAVLLTRRTRWGRVAEIVRPAIDHSRSGAIELGLFVDYLKSLSWNRLSKGTGTICSVNFAN